MRGQDHSGVRRPEPSAQVVIAVWHSMHAESPGQVPQGEEGGEVDGCR
jgi:hypothetical protein